MGSGSRRGSKHKVGPMSFKSDTTEASGDGAAAAADGSGPSLLPIPAAAEAPPAGPVDPMSHDPYVLVDVGDSG